ncbi:MAG: HD domain-containing protein [Desulfatirhabdiaceae bacterium]
MSIPDIARELLNGGQGSHDWDHTLRVVRLCEHIGRIETADMAVLNPAAYLHDIGRQKQDESGGTICHAEYGAKLAEPLIRNLPLTDHQKNNILHCIRSHRFRSGHAPETSEARILFDADKLDAIGAIGVARAFLFAGEIGAKLHSSDVAVEDSRAYTVDDTGYREYRVKLQHILDRILTREGKKLAQARHRFMTDFFQQFLQEYEGNR